MFVRERLQEGRPLVGGLDQRRHEGQIGEEHVVAVPVDEGLDEVAGGRVEGRVADPLVGRLAGKAEGVDLGPVLGRQRQFAVEAAAGLRGEALEGLVGRLDDEAVDLGARLEAREQLGPLRIGQVLVREHRLHLGEGLVREVPLRRPEVPVVGADELVRRRDADRDVLEVAPWPGVPLDHAARQRGHGPGADGVPVSVGPQGRIETERHQGQDPRHDEQNGQGHQDAVGQRQVDGMVLRRADRLARLSGRSIVIHCCLSFFNKRPFAPPAKG